MGFPLQFCGVLLALLLCCTSTPARGEAEAREEVVFWHFWGGRDRPVVEGVIRRFNESQNRYRVRGVAMPGANLDLKLFLSIAGGNPPDVMNHDDPVVADWAARGALTPLDQLGSAEEIERLEKWLYPSAARLGSYRGRLFALVNGLDIRALYFNRTALREVELDGLADEGPQTLSDLDLISEAIAPAEATVRHELNRVGFLPDPRRFWAWAIVFGGRFSDPHASDAEGRITLDCEENLAALRWMAGFSERYGADRVASFRSGDQALTGASFPLLADRRYTVLMDGQWRVRDLAEAAAASARRGEPFDEYGVCPLPPPLGGRERAGWVNGNFFIVPRGAKQPQGAWEFMKFWAGFDGAERQAAITAAEGGWIPPSEAVVRQPEFQRFLERMPLFREFVELAASEHQTPTPALPVASFYYREVVAAASDVMYRGADPEARLAVAARRVRRQLEEHARP